MDIEQVAESKPLNIKTKKQELTKIEAKAEKRKNKSNLNNEEDKNAFASKHSKMKPDIQMANASSDGEEKEVANNLISKEKIAEPKKVKKTRKVKKTKTYKDEEGFDVTNEVIEDEEYWTDEKSQKSNASASIKNNLNKPSAAGPAKKPVNAPGKKGNFNQRSLEMFFKK